MTTKDGCTITTIEQQGEYQNHDIGRIWIHNKSHMWTWYGGFASEARRQAVITMAQSTTWLEFDHWFDTEP